MIDQLTRPMPGVSPKELAFDILRRAAMDPAFQQGLTFKPEDTLRGCGVTDPGALAEMTALTSLVLRGVQANTDMAAFAKNQLQSTSATVDAFKIGLRKTIDQIDVGFQSTMTMSKVAFYLGIILIVASGGYAVVTGKTLFSLIFAGLGAADIIGFFVVNPPRDIQRSRANLAQLQAALFNWFTDVLNWNGYLQGLFAQQADPFPRMKEVSVTLLENTERMMGLIDKYCEGGGEKPAK